jgi:hypothetical protein
MSNFFGNLQTSGHATMILSRSRYWSLQKNIETAEDSANLLQDTFADWKVEVVRLMPNEVRFANGAKITRCEETKKLSIEKEGKEDQQGPGCHPVK